MLLRTVDAAGTVDEHSISDDSRDTTQVNDAQATT
jgi:hypothetical protein